MNTGVATLERAQPGGGEKPSTSELLLVAQAKSGHSGAFGELYERHRLKIFRSAFRILRNRQDAEDAVQRSFQKAFTNLRRFREDSSFSTWVTRIGINEALMLLRQRHAPSSLWRTHSEALSEISPDVPDERSTPEQALAEEELQSLVHRAVSRLRESLRSVVLLRELQGFTSAETARRLGLTVSTVKARTFRARRYLRKDLEKKMQGWLW